MLELLIEELAAIGLTLNGKKNNILTNENNDYHYIDVAGEMVEIVDDSKTYNNAFATAVSLNNLNSDATGSRIHRIPKAQQKQEHRDAFTNPFKTDSIEANRAKQTSPRGNQSYASMNTNGR